ncbi:MAG: DUF1415 family protein [Bacteroidetes bacterium]|nr:MAG: DUF1415 family protein [Bacteroidota bacterium]
MLSEQQKKETIDVVQKWVETFIIGLNLCPFAKLPFQNQEIRFIVADTDNMKSFLEAFMAEIDFLDENPTTETTLMIIPAFGKIEQFQIFFNFCEETLVLNNLEKKYQIVSFHPYARFKGVPVDSPRNLTAMAPYPIVHILKVDSVQNLGANLKKDVITENDKKLRKMPKEEMLQLWAEILS